MSIERNRLRRGAGRGALALAAAVSRRYGGASPRVELLEGRVLLSSTVHRGHLHLHHHLRTSAAMAVSGSPGFASPAFMLAAGLSRGGKVRPAGSSGPTGFTPARMRAAYGVQNIMFGSVAGDGTGQTIAIVDAYHDPTVVADLAGFDARFGLPAPPLFTVVAQDGSTTYPTVDPAGAGKLNWETETALDVEWAHVMAPNANLLLVEAKTAGWDDMVTKAVGWARKQPGVVAVSMSFGGTEWSGETAYESVFSTPANHAPVAFFAASGDSGKPGTFPAYSPKVVAVGGTSLYDDGQGNYQNELAWSKSGGGISGYESEPSYQKNVVTQSTTRRTIPDVALDADPNQGGVSVYDSYNNGTTNPWSVIGGTSLASPMMAGLVAVADQGRALAGLSPLDGYQTLLPRLYQLPASALHDISSGSNGYLAAGGYDLVTGRGTPVANKFVPLLVSSGPFVLTSAGGASAAAAAGTASYVDFNFSQPMDDSSFSLATGIRSFTGPGGVDLSGQLTGFIWLSPTTLRITFSPQVTAGTYTMVLSSQVHSTAGIALDQNGNYVAGEVADAFTDVFSVASSVAGRYVFYNNSGLNDPTFGHTDDDAIDTGKSALLPGGTASFANYTGSSQGINGVMVDISGLPAGALSASDFTFTIGNVSDPAGWAAAPALQSIIVRRGQGTDGSDRIELIWPDNAIQQQWLRVSIKADANTGLAAPDVFYFGNQIGETGNSSDDTFVDASDMVAIRDNITASGSHELASSRFDLNHDGFADASDMVVVRDHVNDSSSRLQLIAPVS